MKHSGCACGSFYAIAIIAAAIGCGTHHDASMSMAVGASGSSAVPAGDDAGLSAAPTPSPSTTCGGTTCAPPPDLLYQLGGALVANVPIPVACCVRDACGTAATVGSACAERATADTSCPTIDPGLLGMFTGTKIDACCTVDGACGIDEALFGMGCVENGAAAMQLATIPVLGTSIKVPAPQSCTPKARTPDTGTSTEDAGL